MITLSRRRLLGWLAVSPALMLGCSEECKIGESECARFVWEGETESHVVVPYPYYVRKWVYDDERLLYEELGWREVLEADGWGNYSHYKGFRLEVYMQVRVRQPNQDIYPVEHLGRFRQCPTK